MTAETIAKALGGRKAGRGWTARCPAHDDREPSRLRAQRAKVLGICRSRRKDMLRVELVMPPSSLHIMLYRRQIILRRSTPRKGTIMKIAKPASTSSRLKYESVLRTDLDRTAEERSENEGMTEHAQKALDPIAWEKGRIRRSNDGDYIVSKLPEERDEVGRGAPVETTDLERRVLVLERILQALIAHMAETEPSFIDRLSVTFTDPIRVAHEEQNHIDTASYAERFIREIVRLGEQPGEPKIHTRRSFPNPKRLEQRVAPPLGVPNRLPVVFELRHHQGIWEVTKDGRFFGDFLSEREALDSAQDAVRSVVGGGGFASLSGAVDRPLTSGGGFR